MKVLCNGWGRNVLYHELVDRDISQANATKNGRYFRGEVYVEVKDDEVHILSDAEGLRLHGDFLLQVRLTRKEIANLAMIAYGKKRLGGFVDALAKMRTPKLRKRK